MRLFRLALVISFSITLSAQTSPAGETLFAAIKRGAAADVERLLKRGTDANFTSADGTPALMAATLFGDAEMLQVLLRRGAEPNRPGPSGATALMWAVPDVEKVRLLLDRGANANAVSQTGRTTLLVAASFPGTRNLLQLLLDRGADLRAEDRGGVTALALAVRSSDVEVVRFLVEKGLDPNTLSAAAKRQGPQRNDPSVAEYLMSRLTPYPDVLITAATWQRTSWITHWIESGADVNASLPAVYARTPLLSAVTSEVADADTLRLLLARGANPNAMTTEGESPLDWAIYKGDRAKIQILEQYGAIRGRGPRQQEIAPSPSGGIADAKISL